MRREKQACIPEQIVPTEPIVARKKVIFSLVRNTDRSNSGNLYVGKLEITELVAVVAWFKKVIN